MDEVMQETVRANHGTTSSSNAASGRDPFGGVGVGPPPSKMSKERIHKVRQKAVTLLAKAFATDEIATSVVTMQASSSVQDIAEHILKRDAGDLDAKYVHFFHEKVPSLQMEEYTTTATLGEIIDSRPWPARAAPLRTRGIVSAMKNDHASAVDDFTLALRIVHECNAAIHNQVRDLILAGQQTDDRSRMLPEHQPTGLEAQLLFHRAGSYLSLACESIAPALGGDTDATKQHQIRLEARKRVKTYARRACKDYLAFVSTLKYTPGHPKEWADDLARRMEGQPAQSHKNGLSIEATASMGESETEHSNALVRRQAPQKNGTAEHASRLPPLGVFPASALFAEKRDPSLDQQTAPGLREAVTYHPLLRDALHSLLLCHCLLQTSPTELNRHAHSAARLCRIAYDNLIFSHPRSPARTDWMEVLRRCDNWIKLDAPWFKLCTRPTSSKQTNGGQANGTDTTPAAETAQERRERIKQQALYGALGDARVVDEKTFQESLRVRESQGLIDDERDAVMFSPEATKESAIEDSTRIQTAAEIKRWAQEEAAKEYPLISDRAALVARWVREAPLHVPGAGGKKKKRSGTKRKKVAGLGGVVDGMGQLDVNGVESDDQPD
ncbi:hypothetical protein ANO11243_004060 [Dothideomycetidae sp. 11243]|nr:hypothetical protein ANO11243_004060 [fungal sp. No.11243]